MENKNRYLSIEDLYVYLGRNPVLKEITLEIEKGEMVALIGPNGAGKSSLIKAILGLVAYQKGRIYFQGKSLDRSRELQAFRRKTGYVPQTIDFDRDTPVTVLELMMASVPSTGDKKQKVLTSLEEVGASDYLLQRLGTLSGGQLQRIMIALNLMKTPEILFLDEPASGIDIHGQELFFELLQRIKKERDLTVVLVSHDIGVVHNFASRVVCVNQTLRCSGPPQLILTPENIREIYDTDSSIYVHHHPVNGGKK